MGNALPLGDVRLHQAPKQAPVIGHVEVESFVEHDAVLEIFDFAQEVDVTVTVPAVEQEADFRPIALT